MADIFLSYANEDREAARALADILEAADWSSLLSRSEWIAPGVDWRSAREEALRDGRCILVLWSARAVKSAGLAEEAGAARPPGVKVIPICLRLPISSYFSRYSGRGSDGLGPLDGYMGSVQQLMADLESILARSGQRAAPAPSPSYSHPAGESYDEPASARPSSAPGGGGAASVLRETAAAVARGG